MKIYELKFLEGDRYYSLGFSASKAKLEQLINDVKAHDAKYVSYKDDDLAYLDWEETHPLQPYLNDISCATGGKDLAYYLEENKHENGISWASFLEVDEHELNDFDPFAMLYFYENPLFKCDYIANGKEIEYRILNFGNPEQFRVIVNPLENIEKELPDDFKSLEQAQAWCQKDYDIYYKGLNDE